MSRSFRARPLDVSRQLELVTDVDLLDSQEGLPSREVVHNHAALDADNEKVRPGLWAAAAGGRLPPLVCDALPLLLLLLLLVAGDASSSAWKTGQASSWGRPNCYCWHHTHPHPRIHTRSPR